MMRFSAVSLSVDPVSSVLSFHPYSFLQPPGPKFPILSLSHHKDQKTVHFPYSVFNIKILRSKYNLSFFYRSRCVLMTVQKAQEALKVEEKNQFRPFLNRAGYL